MTEKEMKSKITQAHTDGYNRGLAKAEEKIAELKETLAQTIENDEVIYETLKLHDQEEIGMLNSRVAELEQQIEKMKCCQNCADGESCENNGLVYVCDKWRFEK